MPIDHPGFGRGWLRGRKLRAHGKDKRSIHAEEPDAVLDARSPVAVFNATESAVVRGGNFANVNAQVVNITYGSTSSPGVQDSADNQWYTSSSPLPEGSKHSSRPDKYTARRDSQLYHDSLYGHGRGSPLWTPGPNLNLPEEYRRTGVRIGDVGIINAQGVFSFLFNILHRPDDDVNRNMVPPSFESLDVDIRPEILYSHTSDQYFVSDSVNQSTSIDQNGLIFETHAEEGAVLTIPGGAHSSELENLRPFQSYISRHLESWYQYVNKTRGREAKNGEIRLVYGTDKVAAWGMATFSSRARKTQRVRLEFRRLNPADSSAKFYSWKCTGTAAGRVGPSETEHQGLRGGPIVNQAVFIRTLCPKLSEKVWQEKITSTVLADDGCQSSSEPNSQYTLRSLGPQSTHTGTYARYIPGPSNSRSHQAENTEAETSLLHPSDVLNEVMLSLATKSSVVISDDKTWMVIAEKISLPPPSHQPVILSPLYIANLISDMLRRHDGTVHLCDSVDNFDTLEDIRHARPTVASQAIRYQPWRAGFGGSVDRQLGMKPVRHASKGPHTDFEAAQDRINRFLITKSKEDLQQALYHFSLSVRQTAGKHPNVLLQYANALELHTVNFGLEPSSPDVLSLLQEVECVWKKQEPWPNDYPRLLLRIADLLMDRIRRAGSMVNVDTKEAEVRYDTVLIIPASREDRRDAHLGLGMIFFHRLELSLLIEGRINLSHMFQAILHMTAALHVSSGDTEGEALCLIKRAAVHDMVYKRVDGPTKDTALRNAMTDYTSALECLKNSGRRNVRWTERISAYLKRLQGSLASTNEILGSSTNCNPCRA